MQHIKHYSLCLLVVFALLLGALISAQPALAKDGTMKGNGTQESPYQIEGAEDLIEFARRVNDNDPINEKEGELNAWAELKEDIDLENTSWTPIAYNYEHPYSGTFDGNNHTIRGLSINNSSTNYGYFGLFGAVGEGGTVKDLTVEGNINIDSEYEVNAGGVVGENAGNVSNCTSEVAITVEGVYAYIGGIIGSNAGNVSNCTHKAAITVTADTAYIGGVIGFNGGSLTNCSNSGAVAGTGQTAYVGGIVGSNNHTESVMGSVENCYNTGTVTATGSNAVAGGVMGVNLNTVNSCYNTGTVTGTTAGGVVGANSYGTTPGTVTSCYNVGKVAASSEGTTIGGVVGANSNGSTSGTVNGCYYLNTVAGSAIGDSSGTSENVASKTTEEFASGEVAWLLQDAVEQDGSTTTQVWGQEIGANNYPELLAFDASAQKVYRVAFEYNYDYEGTENAAYANSGSPVSVPTTPEREGYAFGGWYSDKDFNTKWNFDTDTVTEDINLYAKWTARIYPVTLITNGGTIESGDVTGYTYGVGVTLPVDVIRPGYTFGGWYAEADFSDGKVIEISTTDTGDKTFYAKWLSADTGVSRVIVSDQDAAINGNAISVTLPAGSSLPTAGDIQITAAEGATVSDLSTEDGGTTWTFTVTAEDGTTEMYTIQVTIAPLPAYTVTVAASSHGSVMANPTSAAAGETVTLTIAPETGYTLAGLNVADANGTAITVNGSETTYTFTMPDSAVTVTATFRLIEEPVDPTPAPTPTPDPDPSGPSTGESDGWESIADEITAADDGDSITIDMNGETEVPSDIFEDVAGKDVDLVFDMGDGLSWSVNGQDIPEGTNLTDLDLGVDLGTDGIPVDVINAITGEKDSVQITLAYDGEFGFTLTLTAPLGEDNAGYWANLYHYDEDTEAMNFEAAAEIGADGSVSLPLSHASQYAIVIDDHSYAATDVSEIFTDVPANHWAQAAIQYVYDNGLMTGVSDSEFAPEATTTRAMIVSMLARMENVTSAADAGFSDVAADDWYATAVNWAAANGIVNGISADTFAPNDPITREQLAAMLMNYAQYKGMDVSARADLSHYSDAENISSWANDVLSWAVAEGLLTGVTDDTIAPQVHATRAQVAAILQRFLSE